MLQIQNLTKLFRNSKGIKNVSFNIEEGEIVGFVGANGAGKSTMIKTIFNEYVKDSGQILLNGKEINKNDMKELAYFPDQSVYPGDISLYDYAFHAARLCGIAKSEANRKILFLLDSLDLVPYKKKSFNVLSSGMQKRALVLITLITSPKIIFLDEPTANLDVQSRFELLELLKILANKGKSILITSHNIDELEKIIDKLVVIKNGEIVYNKKFDGNTESIKKIYFTENEDRIKQIKYEKIAEM